MRGTGWESRQLPLLKTPLSGNQQAVCSAALDVQFPIFIPCVDRHRGSSPLSFPPPSTDCDAALPYRRTAGSARLLDVRTTSVIKQSDNGRARLVCKFLSSPQSIYVINKMHTEFVRVRSVFSHLLHRTRAHSQSVCVEMACRAEEICRTPSIPTLASQSI